MRKKARDPRIEMSKRFDSSKHIRIHFWSKRESINWQNLGVAVGFED